MSEEFKGFGPSPDPQKKKASPGAQKRKAASKQYDKLRDEGLPEFTIFVRLPDKPDNWLPVGSVAVKRSSAINAAIFQNEEDLLKGAIRTFPRLAKHRDELEYGYRLKDKQFADEPIQLAVRPTPSVVQQAVEKARGWLQNFRLGKG